MSVKTIYDKTIEITNQIWNTQEYEFNKPNIYTSETAPNGVYIDGGWIQNKYLHKYGELYTESNSTTVWLYSWEYSYISAPTIIMPTWVENYWNGELYAEYYIYHELSHAINAALNKEGGHDVGFQATFEEVVKDAIAANDLPEHALKLFEDYESDYAFQPDGTIGYSEPAAKTLMTTMLETVEEAEVALDNEDVSFDAKFALVQDVIKLPESLVFETEVRDIQIQMLDAIQIDNVIDVLRHIVDLEDNSDKFIDFNGDGKITISDAIVGLRLIVDLDSASDVLMDMPGSVLPDVI